MNADDRGDINNDWRNVSVEVGEIGGQLLYTGWVLRVQEGDMFDWSSGASKLDQCRLGAL